MTEPSGEKLADELGSILDNQSDREEHRGHAAAPAQTDRLRQVLSAQDAAAIAMALDKLDPEQAARAFEILEDSRAVEVLGKVGPASARAISESLPEDKFRQLVEQLPERKAAAAVAEAPPRRARHVIDDVQDARPSEAEDLETRLRYAPGSAGRLMTTHFVRLRPAMAAREALDIVRETNHHADVPNDLYVVESIGHNGTRKERLTGVLSIRAALMAPPETPIRDIMATDPVTIKATAGRMDAARLLATNAFMVLPVVDDDDALLGVIPVDDLMRDVVSRLERLNTQAVGTDAAEMEHLSPFAEAKKRVPWLLGTMAIEMGSGLVISHFDQVLQQVILLASFLPVLSAVAGNVGLQAAAIIVRALDTGHASLGRAWSAIRKEVFTTALMAVVCGVALGSIGIVWSGRFDFGIVVGGALAVSMLTAAVMGTIIPMISKRLGFDPATTAGPFETAFQDVIGYAVFLWLASMLLSHLT